MGKWKRYHPSTVVPDLASFRFHAYGRGYSSQTAVSVQNTAASVSGTVVGEVGSCACCEFLSKILLLQSTIRYVYLLYWIFKYWKHISLNIYLLYFFNAILSFILHGILGPNFSFASKVKR